MMLLHRTILPLLLAIVAMHFSFEDSEARRRIGGGRSFGSKPTMSRERAMPNNQNQMNRQGAQSDGATKQASGGGLGGMGGLLTGVLAGTLLGSLFSGSGFGGGFLGLILIGLFVFVGFRIFQSLSRSRQQERYRPAEETTLSRTSYQDSAWAMLDSEADTKEAVQNVSFPKDFNEEEFIKGAKILFARLQESWAKNDLEDIRKFTSTEVFTEIIRQADEDPEIGDVAILHIDARVLEVKDTNDERRVLVFFSALLQESKEAENSDVNEYWHFVRSDKSEGMWILDGIQQSR
ncbi:MAG: Tim44 domain-containing protein [Desulfovibrionaceae bacterium]